MTNSYKLKSGKVISEGQTITAYELTVAEFYELSNDIVGEYRPWFRETIFNLSEISFGEWPITIKTLPTPEPEAPLTVDKLLKAGLRYEYERQKIVDALPTGVKPVMGDWSHLDESKLKKSSLLNIGQLCTIDEQKTLKMVLISDEDLEHFSYATGRLEVIQNAPNYPITIPWVPIEQIGEVFPDWETSDCGYIVRIEGGYTHLGYYERIMGWHNAGDFELTPTHFSPVILEG